MKYPNPTKTKIEILRSETINTLNRILHCKDRTELLTKLINKEIDLVFEYNYSIDINIQIENLLWEINNKFNLDL